MKLVDTLAEQEIVEALVDATKPPVPAECQGLHFLLSTPFRYAPYPNGSRFRRAGLTPGVYYAAEDERTAAAETAFYRILFFAELPATPWPANPLECTGFSVEVLSHCSLDLTKPPLDADDPVWRHPIKYEACQDFADAARKASAEILRYASARAPGACVAILACGAFAEAEPRDRQTWRIGVSPSGAYALREFPEARIEFGRDAFAADPRIAAMQWER